ncbi:MAG: hypothetical protein V1778_02405 [bacterium]
MKILACIVVSVLVGFFVSVGVKNTDLALAATVFSFTIFMGIFTIIHLLLEILEAIKK